MKDDWVRLEVAGALAGTAEVLPLLVDGAEMPEAEAIEDVPGLAELPKRQSRSLRTAEWTRDFEAIVDWLRQKGQAVAGAGPP